MGNQGSTQYSIEDDAGQDNYTTTEQDNLQAGTSQTTTNGTGTYSVEDEDVSTPISGTSPVEYSVTETHPTGTYAYSDSQSANNFADTSTLSQSGSDRYSVLMSFNNTADDANSERGGLVYSPVGLPEQVNRPSDANGMIGEPGEPGDDQASSQTQVLNGFVLTGNFWHDLPVELADAPGNWVVGVLTGMGLGSAAPAQSSAGAAARSSGASLGQELAPITPYLKPALRVGGGLLQVAAGSEALSTGIFAPLGWATIVHGVSDIIAGIQDAINGGGFSSSPVSSALQDVGVSKSTADSADQIIGIALTAGSTGLSAFNQSFLTDEAIGVTAAESEGAGIAVNNAGFPNPMVEVTRTTPSSLIAAARAQYNLVTGRAMFLDQFASTAEAQAYFTDEELALMRDNQLPDAWVVHHMQPLFRGGDNSFDNLIVVPEQWHTDNFFDLHFYPEGQNPFGRN